MLKNKQFLLSLFALLIICEISFAQKVHQHEEELEGEIYLSETIAIPVENAGYTLLLPEDNEADGLVIFLNANRKAGENVEEPSLEFYALKNNLGVMYITTGNRLEFFFEKDTIKKVDRYIGEAIIKYKIPKGNLFFAGMSLAGTRVLKYAQFCVEGKSNYVIMPAAIAVCDSPLDFVRFWREMDKAEKLKATDITANEGEWVSAYLEKNLGGSPDEKLKNYLDYSVYSYLAEDGGKVKLLKNIPIRAYTEPDVKWWMKTRKKDYYSMNAIDLAAAINELNILGKENAELIITHDKGYHPDGTRHPHSWSIVDNKELVDWFVTFMK